MIETDHRLLSSAGSHAERAPCESVADVRTGHPLRPNRDGKSGPVRHRAKRMAGRTRVAAMPQIRRVPMAPAELDRRPLRRLCRNLLAKLTRRAAAANRGTASPAAGSCEAPWRRAGKRRRIVLAMLVLAQTAVACWSLMRTFPAPELNTLQIAIIVNFAVLFSWLSFSFWSNVAGFWTLWRNCRTFSLGAGDGHSTGRPLRSRTAVLMPICNEDAARCFAGLEAIYRSVVATGEIERFEFYVLSDSGEPKRQAEEEKAWLRTCRGLHAFGRIFYRHRRNNIKRKSGNIADFLRRWGQGYDYMVVLDADSVMSGECLVALAGLMERSPQAGIIQTTPAIVNGGSLFARVQQFSSRCYGPLFGASLHYWQLGEGYYWGHNAIIRVAPFVKHCGLARLPGRPPLGGEILSHDFVEAALMGRAGWEVWLACDLPGSYEETPPTLLDELKRDRRWCQGNLQHLRVLPGDRIGTGHRAILCMGVMAYASALLWIGFLLLTNVEMANRVLIPPEYFLSTPSLFPIWPRWHPEWAVALVSTTALLLFLPKFLSLLLILKSRRADLFGGPARLAASIALEILISTALAPIRMWFHAKFVLLTLLGRPIQWTAQRRTGDGAGWWEATRAHGLSTLFAGLWIAWLYWLPTAISLWLLPVATTLLLSIPLSVGSSSSSFGLAARRWRLFLIPEEHRPVPVLDDLQQAVSKQREPDVLRRLNATDSYHRISPLIAASRRPGRLTEKPFILV